MQRTTTSRSIVWIGIALILISGLIHLIDASDAFGDAAYKGVLFLANGVGAIVAAIGIYRGVRSWGWTLGLAIAALTFIAYVLSRTVGLPSLPAEPDAWLEPLGVVSLVVEALFVALAAWVLSRPQSGDIRRSSLEA